MDHDGKQRAKGFVLHHMAEARLDGAALAHVAGVDPATVRTFLDGASYPQKQSRRRIEDALGLPRGEIERAALGLVAESTQDPVERAIEASELSRGQKHKLIGTYYDMLDRERGVG